jgi:hypothetical protein
MKLVLKMCFLVIASLLIHGCASTVNRTTGTIKEVMVQQTSFSPIKSLTVKLDSKAQQKLADNLNFSDQKLYDKINLILTSGNYLQTKNANAKLTIDVVVTNIRVRSAATALILGIFAGADYITGQVYLKDGDKVIDIFEVDITYALSGSMGDTNTRMDWMYESFATKILEELKKLMPISK